jgi:succinate dehydrogenase flavin-adding protein (antitoxin of CptAB toxin-antitoxin module)
MPCQSYDSRWDDGSDARKIRELKKQCDMLARIACKAMTELERNEVEDMLILKDDEVRTWWKKHKEDDAREQARIVELLRKERVKEEALASLSDEAKELLGLKKPAPKKKNVVDDFDEYEFDEDECIEDDGEWLEHDEILPSGVTVRTFRIK